MHINTNEMNAEERKRYLFGAVNHAIEHGICVVPPKNDGTKQPFPEDFTTWHKEKPNSSQLKEWYKKGLTGVGYVCGAISDNLEVLNFNDCKVYMDFRHKLGNLGLSHVVDILENGYFETTPNGFHAYYRCSEIGSSQILATRPKHKKEKLHSDGETTTIIEVIGECGYVIGAPSYGGVHTGSRFKAGRGYDFWNDFNDAEFFASIPRITPEDREILLDVARGFDTDHVNDPDNENDDTENNEQLVVSADDRQPEADETLTAPPPLPLTADEIMWELPVLFGDPKGPEIPSNLFPPTYGEYIDAVAKSTQTPTGMGTMFLLSVLATCLQGKAIVAPRADYTEPLPIWTVTAMESGNRKSGVMNHFLAPVTAWEDEQATSLESRENDLEADRQFVEQQIAILKKKQSKAGNAQELKQLMNDINLLTNSMPDKTHVPTLYTGDVNSEGLQKLLAENGGRMSVLVDEGGIFEVMSGMFSGGKVNINTFLQAHSGTPIRVNRAGRKVTINNPALTFGLMVQPDIVAKINKNSAFRGNGCLARFLFCIPESSVGNRDVRNWVEIPEDLKAAYHCAIKSLLDLPTIGRDSCDFPILKLDDDTQNAWLDFSQRIEDQSGSHGNLASIGDWACKLAGASLRIAGLLHIAEKGLENRLITVTTMSNSIRLCELLIDHAKIAFGSIYKDRAAEDAQYLYELIISNRQKQFRRNDLHRQVHGKFTKVERLKAALEILTDRNIISEPISKHTGRRPEILYDVNPALWKYLNC